jgi:hypothetical protein
MVAMCRSIPSRASALNHRADIGGEPVREPDRKLVHRAPEHREHALGGIFLNAENAQRRAALPGRVERGGEHVPDHLLGKRGGIDDERVKPAGLGDQTGSGVRSGRRRPASWRLNASRRPSTR